MGRGGVVGGEVFVGVGVDGLERASTMPPRPLSAH